MARRRRKQADDKKNAGNGGSGNLGFESKLWAAADKLRGHMDAAVYSSSGFNTHPMVAPTNVVGRATFTYTTTTGEQASGDRTVFYMPTFLDVPGVGRVTFTGHWPDEGPRRVETTAP